MKKFTSLLLACVLGVFVHAQNTPVPPQAATKVVLDDASSAIFPASWINGSTKPTAEPLGNEAHERARRIFSETLALYPTEVLNNNLKAVYGLGRLTIRDVVTAGSNSRAAIYVVMSARLPDDTVRRVVHAEFSSILLRNHKSLFPETSWTLVNPEGFVYSRAAARDSQDGSVTRRYDPALLEQGFIRKFSQASVEEDFRAYASLLLVGDGQLWEAMETYPRVKAKAALTMQFYAAMNPKFTPEFFAGLRRQEG